MKSKRRYVPCKECGKSHTNPSSSSICDTCGPIYRLRNLAEAEAIKAKAATAEVETIEEMSNSELANELENMANRQPLCSRIARVLAEASERLK